MLLLDKKEERGLGAKRGGCGEEKNGVGEGERSEMCNYMAFSVCWPIPSLLKLYLIIINGLPF